MTVIYLAVSYAQRNEAKALGARWDPDARRWYVPQGLDLQPFRAWLPAETGTAVYAVSATGTDSLPAEVTGISLSRLLQGVSAAVSEAFRQGVWTRVEVVQISLRGHVYLEVAERDAEGRVLARTRAMIWSAVAGRILPEFERSTGMQLAPGIKLLVRAQPTMHAEHGFGLRIDAIDSQYTLGDLERRRREIRHRLRQEGLWDGNRRLPAPWDFREVLVVAPEQAAGLGDFQAEADRLQAYEVCRFTYAHSVFQGAMAPALIRSTAQTALDSWAGAQPLPDALVIIRGGGAVNDLAWLDDYDLARFICEAPVPVFTGIGHQRDNSILDEVAHSRFDTPSKVIAGIEALAAQRARESHASFGQITAQAAQIALRRRQQTSQALEVMRHHALRIHGLAGLESERLMSGLKQDAQSLVYRAAQRVQARHGEVNQGAHASLAGARARVPALMHAVAAGSRSAVRQASQLANDRVAAVTERAVRTAHRGEEAALHAVNGVTDQVRRALASTRQSTQALFREIAGQGPEKTLRRGFALVTDDSGTPITRAAQAGDQTSFVIRFQDGNVPVQTQQRDPS